MNSGPFENNLGEIMSKNTEALLIISVIAGIVAYWLGADSKTVLLVSAVAAGIFRITVLIDE